MSYENQILISKKALKELKTIPERERSVIKNRISRLAYFPLVHLDVKKLKGHQDVYRLRSGNYRIIFEYFEEDKVIKILKVGRRSGIYYYNCKEGGG